MDLLGNSQMHILDPFLCIKLPANKVQSSDAVNECSSILAKNSMRTANGDARHINLGPNVHKNEKIALRALDAGGHCCRCRQFGFVSIWVFDQTKLECVAYVGSYGYWTHQNCSIFCFVCFDPFRTDFALFGNLLFLSNRKAKLQFHINNVVIEFAYFPPIQWSIAIPVL